MNRVTSGLCGMLAGLGLFYGLFMLQGSSFSAAAHDKLVRDGFTNISITSPSYGGKECQPRHWCVNFSAIDRNGKNAVGLVEAPQRTRVF